MSLYVKGDKARNAGILAKVIHLVSRIGEGFGYSVASFLPKPSWIQRKSTASSDFFPTLGHVLVPRIVVVGLIQHFRRGPRIPVSYFRRKLGVVEKPVRRC